MFFAFLYYVIVIVQGFFSYGTIYRLTKNGGDNGIAMFGWSVAISLASAVPGLGMYLWYRNRDI